MFSDVLQNLERSKRLLFSSANIAHIQEAQDARLRTEESFKEQRERARKERRMTAQTWLNAFQHRNQQDELRSLRKKYPETASWLFTSSVWRNWWTSNGDDERVLWLSGIPGAGKPLQAKAGRHSSVP